MNFHSHHDRRATENGEASAETSSGPDQAEMLLQATSAIAFADEAVLACGETFEAVLQKASRKVQGQVNTALVAIYGAILRIEQLNNGAQFLDQRGIKAHGNVTNPYQPYLRAFTKRADPLVRSKICKYAQVVALARHENVAADDIGDWLKAHPIEEACREYRRIVREQSNSQRDAERRRASAILVDPKKEPDKAPLLSATPITPGYTGLKLAVVDFANDGSGDFRLLGILPHERDAVMRMVMTAASKATSTFNQE